MKYITSQINRIKALDRVRLFRVQEVFFVLVITVISTAIALFIAQASKAGWL